MAAQNIMGQVNFVLNADNVEVTRELLNAAVNITNKVCDTVVSFGGEHTVQLARVAGRTVVTLGALYAGYDLLKLLIDAATRNGFGGERGDQNFKIRKGSLHVRLGCFTNERFLEVLADYEFGRIKERLQKEFSNVGIKVEGLKIEIENMEEVEKTRAAIMKSANFVMAESSSKDLAVQDTPSNVLQASLKDGVDYSFVISTCSAVVVKGICDAAVGVTKELGAAAVGVTKELGGAAVVGVTKELGCAAVGVTKELGGAAVGVTKELGCAAVEVTKALGGGTVVSLGLICAVYKLIDKAIEKTFGGKRKDQKVEDIKPGSLHVLLRCFTAERFLEVWEDYESGRIKERLQKELSDVGIKVEGLKVEIENMEEVEKTTADIMKRDPVEQSEVKAELGAEETAEKVSGKNQGFQIDISEEHGNWLTVGELIHSIRKPVSVYIDQIFKAFHKKLREDLLQAGKCNSAEDCQIKRDGSKGICSSCWFKKLQEYKKVREDQWKWFDNHWRRDGRSEKWKVAEYFMYPYPYHAEKGDEPTAIYSPLRVLEQMKKGVFLLGKTRVSGKLVREISQVRDAWERAPKQEFKDDKKAESFSTASKFLEHLEKVCPNTENTKCLELLKRLKTSRFIIQTYN